MERLSSEKKVLIGIVSLFSIIVMGVGGFMTIENDNFLNAFYMTIITISTVGFGEIHKLSDGGKIFTMFLIIMSFTTYAYALTTISTYFFEGQLKFFVKGYRTKTFKNMQNHVVICGYGRNGQQAAIELMAHNHKCVVIDENRELIVQNLEKYGNFIEGNATQDETLIKAKIRTAKALITTLPVDADNLYVVLTARALNPGLEIISRATGENSEKKLRMAGVDSVVMPERLGGAHMANLVTTPDIIEFMDHVSVHGDDPTTLEEIVCPELPDNAQSKTIYEIGRRKSGANIIGFKAPDGSYILNPPPETKVNSGSKLFVLGTPEQINIMKEILVLQK